MPKVKKQKVNLDTIQQAHGALAPAQSVQDIMGINSGYKEASYQEYQDKINAMTDSDLHEHAIEMEIVPDHRRTLLIDKLERKYLLAQNRYVYKQNPNKMSTENQETLRKLLRGAQ